MDTTTSLLDKVPQEILSEIAIFAATETFLGPPADLIPLIATNRWTHSCLSFTSNPYIYAQIYQSKFDISAVSRRLGIDSFATISLAQELKRKCLLLNRIRDRRYSRIDFSNPNDHSGETLQEFLTQIYIMVIESDGHNERQLREYARMDEWLMDFWFDDHGTSGSWNALQRDNWPPHNETTCLAMWLFWFLLKPEKYTSKNPSTRRALDVLKIYALGAHKYPLVTPSWTEFSLSFKTHGDSHPVADSSLGLKAPALSVPAILSFISILSYLHERKDYSPLVLSRAPPPALKLPSSIGEWECEWGRSANLGAMKLSGDENKLHDSFRPGSLEGIWEGIFTYTEFTGYAALLSGAPPHFLQNLLVAQHNQTWKLREYHLLSSSSPVTTDPEPVTPGNALHAYFPLGTHIEESAKGIVVIEPTAEKKPLLYEPVGSRNKILPRTEDDTDLRRVLDVIVTGEGHSSWGEFRLIGRVRPCDGFISLSKDYTSGDRGKWLYRGYLVGNHNANLAGRWRDTMSPTTLSGYEGCFTMSRRR